MRLGLALLHVVFVLGRRAFALPSHAVATAATAAATASPPVAGALLLAALRSERLVCLRRAFVGRRLFGPLGAEFLFGLACLIQMTFFRRMFVVTIVLTVWLGVRIAAVPAAPPPTAPPPPTSAFAVLLGGALCWRFALAFVVRSRRSLEPVFFFQRRDRGFGLLGERLGRFERMHLFAAIDRESLRCDQGLIG